VKRFADLSEREIVALAISNEEEDNRIYRSIADRLRGAYPDSAAIYDKMAEEEVAHHGILLALYRNKFGDCLPLIRRQDVMGFVDRPAIWLKETLSTEAARNFVEEMEYEAARFYRRAVETAQDEAVRRVFKQLADAEDKHQSQAHDFGTSLTPQAREAETRTARRIFVLQYIQPGIFGLMDGSVSTLAPVFAAALTMRTTAPTFLVGLAASIGAGISNAFAEALSDDGSLTGRGAPVVRGTVAGAMTTLGGLGHTLPFLIPRFYIATSLACVVVCVELTVISWIRMRFLDTPFLQAAFQVMVGGVLVFIVGILLGIS
jgi:erythrin-vacuolar iron transport family protein